MDQQANNISLFNIITISVSLFALGFSILSFLFTFYWQYWRRTKLIVFKPRQYKIDFSGLQIAFTFFADGPKPIIVQDLQLISSEPPHNPIKFEYSLEQSKNERNKIITFNLDAHEQNTWICVFDVTMLKFLLINKNETTGLNLDKNKILELQAKLGNSKKWVKKLCQFKLNECKRVDDAKGLMTSVPDPFE